MSRGNQWRIPAAEIRRLEQDGIPPLPQIDSEEEPETEEVAASHSDPDDSATVDSDSPEVSEALNQLRITETTLKKRRIERELEEVEDFFRDRAQRIESSRELAAQAQQRAAQEELQRQSIRSWQVYAQSKVPHDAGPECQIAVTKYVSTLLGEIGTGHSASTIRQLVDSAVNKVLRPHNRQRTAERAIDEALRELPIRARGGLQPSRWELKAKQAARTAIAALDTAATEDELRAAARLSIAPIVMEFEDSDARTKIIADLQYWMLGEALEADREQARESATQQLAKIPAPASATIMQHNVDRALGPLAESVRERRKRAARKQHATAVADAHMYFVDHHLRSEYDFDSATEERETAAELKADIRPLLIQELENEHLTDDRVREYIAFLIDEAL